MSDARRAFAAHPFAALLATGFGAGLSPIAPGTAGSAVGLALSWILSRTFASHLPSIAPSVGLLMSGLLIGLLGVAVSGPVCRVLRAEDPGCIVIDEVAGQTIACAGLATLPSPSPAVWIAAFLLFRLFDVWKPGPIRQLQSLPGGWGVVMDDVGAGLAAAILLTLARWI